MSESYCDQEFMRFQEITQLKQRIENQELEIMMLKQFNREIQQNYEQLLIDHEMLVKNNQCEVQRQAQDYEK